MGRQEPPRTSSPIITLVGGVSELYQGDLDVGRRVVLALEERDLGHEVAVEDLHYGAVAVAQRLDELRPACLVLVGAVPRDRAPGSIHRRRVVATRRSPEDVQAAVSDAVTGYVDIDLIVEVAEGFGALPPRTVTVEIEPVQTDPSDQLSPEVEAAVDDLLRAVSTEVDRAPLHTVVTELEARVGDLHLEPSPATAALEALLAELDRADREGRWGSTFALRDELVSQLAQGRASVGMDHADWGLVWGLVEELGRLEKREAKAVTPDAGTTSG